MFGCLLPWSLLIPAAFVPAVRRALAGCDAVAFNGIVLLVAIPTCWIPPGGQTRYLASVYPCFAVLVGVLAERATAVEIAGVMWRRYLLAASVLLCLVAVGGLAGTWLLRGTALERLLLPSGRATVYALLLIGFAMLIAQLRHFTTAGGIVGRRGSRGAGGRGAHLRRA